jgi:hypothetical protein
LAAGAGAGARPSTDFTAVTSTSGSKGLGDIAVGAALQAAQHCFARRLRGQHHHRNVLQHRMLAHAREQVEAVGVGQLNVEQDQVRHRLHAQRDEDFVALVRGARIQAVHLQVGADQLLQVGVIVDHQDRRLPAVLQVIAGEAARDAHVIALLLEDRDFAFSLGCAIVRLLKNPAGTLMVENPEPIPSPSEPAVLTIILAPSILASDASTRRA